MSSEVLASPKSIDEQGQGHLQQLVGQQVLNPFYLVGFHFTEEFEFLEESKDFLEESLEFTPTFDFGLLQPSTLGPIIIASELVPNEVVLFVLVVLAVFLIAEVDFVQHKYFPEYSSTHPFSIALLEVPQLSLEVQHTLPVHQ